MAIILLGAAVALFSLGALERALQAPLGTLAVLGNHELWSDALRVRRAMQQRGSVVLDHQVQQLMRGATCYVAGIGDPFSGHDDVEGTLAQVPLAAPFLVLGHSLDVFSRMTAPPALTLAGHTHGGQLWLPFVGRPIVPSSHGQRHAAGHVVEDGDIRSWPAAWA